MKVKVRIAPYQWYYSLIHFIYGLITGLSDVYLMYAMLITFLAYELVEMIRSHDYAYYEIREFGAGLFFASLYNLTKIFLN